MVTALSVLDHAWLSLPLHLEEAAATSAFPLQLLAPAARGVPGGLIKFDLFLSVKVSPPPPRCPAASPSHHSGGEPFGLPPKPRVG